jgi:DinB superfamily
MTADKVEGAEALPTDLQSVVDELDRTDEEARKLVSGLTEAEVNWQPGAGAGWSVAQCLDHLAQSNTVYTAALRTAVRNVKPGTASRAGPIRPGWLPRLFINALEPPPRRKLKAQKKVMPAAHHNGAKVLSAFVTAHNEVRALVRESFRMDLNRIRFTNPFLRVFHFTVGTGLMVIGAHDRRHLWQAKQVVESMKAAGAQSGGAGQGPVRPKEN